MTEKLKTTVNKQYKQGIIPLRVVVEKVKINRCKEKEKLKMQITNFVRATYLLSLRSILGLV